MKLSIGEILAKFARARAVRAIALGLAAAVAATTLPAATPAAAHGERSQQAFLRMRTLNWYDVKWSKTELNVNDEMELTGKVHVFSGWPQAVAKPENAFLNVGEPGPVLIRKASFVGDVPRPRTFSMEVGKDYEYKLVLKARRQGRYHVHVQINVEDGGPIVGPGQWIDIKGDMAQLHQSGDVARRLDDRPGDLWHQLDLHLPLPVDGRGRRVGALLVHAKGHHRARMAGRRRQGPMRSSRQTTNALAAIWLAALHAGAAVLLCFREQSSSRAPCRCRQVLLKGIAPFR